MVVSPAGRAFLHVLAGLLVIAFLASSTVNAVRKGGDFDTLVLAGHRLIAGATLYEDSAPGVGVTWPPFTAVALVPFSWAGTVHPVAAKLLWHALGLVALLAGLRWWRRALDVGHGAPGPVELLVQPSVLIPLAAIAFPLVTNFEHQNMNPLLLALVGGGAVAMRRERPALAGLALGTAAALKAFPLACIAYLTWRRRWSAAAWAAATTVVLTAVALLRYGWDADHALQGWLAVGTAGGWPIGGSSHSLYSAIGRLLPAAPETTVRLLFIGSAVALGVSVAVALRRRRARATAADVPDELALVLAAAVVCSPIAWEHYWVLLLPAFMIVFDAARRGDRTAAVLFWVAATLTSGLTLVRPGLAIVRASSALTIAAGLLLVAALRTRPRSP